MYILCSAEHLQASFSGMVWTDILFFVTQLTRSVIISNRSSKENAKIYWNLKNS